MQPSPNHFAMRTPNSVATWRTAARNSVRTTTDASSPNSSPNDVNPERSINANQRSTRTNAILSLGRRQLRNERDDSLGHAVQRLCLRDSTRLERLEAVIGGVDPVKCHAPLDGVRVTLQLVGCPERVARPACKH